MQSIKHLYARFQRLRQIQAHAGASAFQGEGAETDLLSETTKALVEVLQQAADGIPVSSQEAQQLLELMSSDMASRNLAPETRFATSGRALSYLPMSNEIMNSMAVHVAEMRSVAHSECEPDSDLLKCIDAFAAMFEVTIVEEKR